MDLRFDLGVRQWFKIFTVLFATINNANDPSVKASIRHYITTIYGPFGDLEGNYCPFEPNWSPGDEILDLYGNKVNVLNVGETYVYIPFQQKQG